MKQQFLDLNGLTELVTYLKKSITEQKEILPYASNKLFPSTGNVNTIYIDTATNSIYRWDSSNKKYEILAKAVKSVSISESTENGKITLTVDGNKTTVPIHGLGSAAYTNSSAYSPAGHTHTKAQVGLGNVDNTADANKSVKHAITADSATTAGTATNVSAGEGTADAARHVWFSDSATETKRAYSDKFKYNPVTNNLTVNVTGNAATASSVAWGNVTGKPSTYAPSAHNHDDSTIISLNASKLFGTIDIARLPHGALERCVIVADDTARFALTTAKIQLGDTVKVNKTQKMYFVIDDSKLNSEAGYTVYTAGSATSVPWSGVTGKPTTFTPSSHTHPYLSALSVSGKTITYTKGDGTTGTITTQDTWRGIQNNLTSTSTTDSLSAAQGKILKGLVDEKLSLSGGTMTGNIAYKGSKATYEMIKFIDNSSDTYGNGIAIGGGGLTIIGGGESSDVIKNAASSGGEERLVLANDGAIEFYTNCQDGIDKSVHTTIDNTGLFSGTAANAKAVPWSGVTGKPTSYPPSSHTHAYLPLSGGTMTGALNFANGIWNVVGDDVAIGDMNISGTLGVMGRNGNTAIKLVQYGASTTSGSAAPGVTWICTGANASTISGTLSGTFSGNLSGTATSANAAPWSGITGKPSTYPPSSHTHAYLPLSGGTMTGALNFANGIWNVVGDDVAIGDMNISGTLGVMGRNGNTAIKLVQYGASTTSGSAAPGVTWICTGANASTISGTLSGTFSGNLSGTATSANAAPWSGITGKPSTYPPSSHTHNYAGSSTAGGIADNANALYKNPSTRQTSANYDLTNDNIYAHRVTYSVASSTMTTAKPPTDAHILTFGWDTNAGYGAQFAVGNSFSNHLYIRGAKSETKDNKNVCTWESSWRTVLDSGNYTSYTVTKTGSGASGTWGINVSGGAAYPTGFNSRVTSATWGNQTGTLITDWHTSNGGDIQFRDNSGQLNVITDGFFYQNEGRNLVLDSSNYSNYAATKGHTHNYAGSSSAGGNANAAVKLATARKIGNASFDGTANITLSQMGLNVPVEITKADYLAKKKAGTLNANTYYNVIDEYDSANVINDSSVTANSAFSSTKSEKTYAKKSAIINTTLTASKWTGSSAPYTYVLPVSGATTSNIVEINYASNASSQAIEAYQNAMLADGGQTTNQITIKATEKPTVDIPITIVIRNDL